MITLSELLVPVCVYEYSLIAQRTSTCAPMIDPALLAVSAFTLPLAPSSCSALMSAMDLRSRTMNFPVLASSVVSTSVSAIAKSVGGGMAIVVLYAVPPPPVGAAMAVFVIDMSITASRFFSPACCAKL